MTEQKNREQRIRERAYFIWLHDGKPDGREKEHWQDADRQIAQEERAESGLAQRGQLSEGNRDTEV